MAIESSFNPFAQSSVGAQGLMQVMTKVHDDKYEPFGGRHAAFDPVTNLRVGVQVLKECIARAGSLEAGLRYYVGAANLATTAATPEGAGRAGHPAAGWPGQKPLPLPRPPSGGRWPKSPTAPPTPRHRRAERRRRPTRSPARPADPATLAEKVALLR